MYVPSADEKLLKALAAAMVARPRGTLKDIAVAAGVSKATLHRFCGTREHLIERLMGYGSQVLNQVIDHARLDSAPPREALRRLIQGHLTHRELLTFLAFQWRPDSMDEAVGGGRWMPYCDALDAFFLRGQREGVFRLDIAAPALSEIFAALIFGLVDAERRGRVAWASTPAMLETAFLEGAQGR